MPTLDEFALAEAIVQAEFKRRGLKIPSTSDTLTKKAAARLDNLFFKDTLSALPGAKSYLSSMLPVADGAVILTEEDQTANLSLKAKAISMEQMLQLVSKAVSTKERSSDGWGMRYYPIATYADSVVAMDYDTLNFVSFPYEITEGSVSLGDPVNVEQEFVEVASSAKGLNLYKDEETGKTRWMAVSSNTFRDAFDERFSREALNEAVKAMEENGYGELRLEHYIASRVGVCDGSKVVGDFLIETGTFDDTPAAKATIKTLESSDEFKISIGYLYNDNYLTDDGVYLGKVRIFERSITRTPANKITAISLEDIGIGGKMDKETVKSRLAAIVGDELADELMKKGDEQLGALSDVLGNKSGSDMTSVGIKNQNADADDDDEEEDDGPANEIEIIDENGKTLRAVREDLFDEGNVSGADLAAIVEKAVKKAVAPLQKEITALKADAKSKKDKDEAPRIVRYRITSEKSEDDDLDDDDEEEMEELKKGLEGDGGSFWDGFQQKARQKVLN